MGELTTVTSVGEHHKYDKLRAPRIKRDELYQLSKEQLVEIIKKLENEIAWLKESLNLSLLAVGAHTKSPVVSLTYRFLSSTSKIGCRDARYMESRLI